MNKRKAKVQTNEKKKRARNWTKEEIDPCADYINTLQKKALKKEANAEVFESILGGFSERARRREFCL